MKNLPAHVSLKSAFSPEQAADLRLTVTVTGPTKEPDPSVLAVQCRSEQGKAKQPTAALWSESASHPQEHGITAALAVPFLQCLPDAGKDTKAIYQALKAKAKDAQEHVEEEHQEDPAVSSEPATGTT